MVGFLTGDAGHKKSQREASARSHRPKSGSQHGGYRRTPPPGSRENRSYRTTSGQTPLSGSGGYAIMNLWNGPGPVFFMSGALRLTERTDGKKRESRDGHDGVHRVQASQLQHVQKQTEHHRPARAQQILPLLPLPQRSSGNKVGYVRSAEVESRAVQRSWTHLSDTTPHTSARAEVLDSAKG
jgi:hypothetical protein